MSEQAGMPGELIYEHAVQIKQMTEYGVAFDGLLSGAAAPPPQGARFDLYVEGTVTGPKLKDTVKDGASAGASAKGKRPEGVVDPTTGRTSRPFDPGASVRGIKVASFRAWLIDLFLSVETRIGRLRRSRLSRTLTAGPVFAPISGSPLP
jgi:hypothetical protein